MNWYEHHIKDYAASIQYHSWDEDMAYTRMIRWYYKKERALPGDPDEVCRMIGARSIDQKAAVVTILADFFKLAADGLFHNEKCDQVLADYLAGQPAREAEREAKKTNQDTRTARHRVERATLFQQLNAAGEHLPYNCPIAELRTRVESLVKAGKVPGVFPKDAGGGVTGAVSGGVTGHGGFPNGETAPVTPVTPPVTGTVTPVTATHPPPTTHHSPSSFPSEGAAPVPPAPPPPAPAKPKAAKVKPPKGEGPTVKTWEAYAKGYERRYGVSPLRNATINGQLSNLVAQLGADVAPQVAEFYLTHPNTLYVRSHHPVALLVRDAQALYTQLATGRIAMDRQPLTTTREVARKNAVEEVFGRSGRPETIDGESRVLEDATGTAPRIGR